MSDARQIVLDAINHRQPERVPVDFGAQSSTGMHCSIIEKLRDHYGLEKRVVKAFEPFQMLGLIEQDLREAIGADMGTLVPLSTSFGNPINDEWKEWRAPWGQIVLVPAAMELDTLADGSTVLYPSGDRSAEPSAKMPASGFYFDAIERQIECDEDNLDPRDNAEEYAVMSDDAIAETKRRVDELKKTGGAVLYALPGSSLSSPSGLYGMAMKQPKGIRRLADWFMAFVAYPDYVKEVYSLQMEVTLQNLDKVNKAFGDDIDIICVCTGDFGTQIDTLFSLDVLEELFCPFYRQMNDWIHQNTHWKTFKHCCGAIEPFIEPLANAGIDILNPVQCSARGMDPQRLKDKHGDRIVFWGGGVDTQQVLPFGTPEAVRAQVLERCRIFSPGGGYVFNAIHNVQARTPVENIIAMLDAVHEFNRAGR